MQLDMIRKICLVVLVNFCVFSKRVLDANSTCLAVLVYFCVFSKRVKITNGTQNQQSIDKPVNRGKGYSFSWVLDYL